MADKQVIEISIKRTSYVVFWYNEVTFFNSAANSKRKVGFCDERKLKKEDVVDILIKQGLDVSNMTSVIWYDNKKWEFSAYEIPKREAIPDFDYASPCSFGAIFSASC